MLLDGQSFELVLTPEAAMGLVSKAVAEKGYAKYEIVEVRLVYTPYWVFTFDIAEPKPFSGKTALSAYTAELSELVPIITERPLRKTYETALPRCEIEPTSVKQDEVKEVASTKLASQLGIKKESVNIFAITKFYIPFFRIWVNVERETYRCDVDACLGSITGLEALPQRAKGLGEQIKALATPKGLAAAITALPSVLVRAWRGEEKGPLAFILGTRTGRILLFVLVIGVLLMVVIMPKPPSITCDAHLRYIKPLWWLNGSCTFQNPSSSDVVAGAVVQVLEKGNIVQHQTITLIVPARAQRSQGFALNWSAPPGKRYTFAWHPI